MPEPRTGHPYKNIFISHCTTAIHDLMQGVYMHTKSDEAQDVNVYIYVTQKIHNIAFDFLPGGNMMSNSH